MILPRIPLLQHHQSVTLYTIYCSGRLQ